jgi:hypothetical protein
MRWMRRMRWMRTRRRRDLVAIALIWSCVLGVAFLLAPAATDDPRGLGELMGAVGMVLTGLCFYLRNLRNRTWLIFRPAGRGSGDDTRSTTVFWVKAVLAVVGSVTASAILITVGVQDGLAVLLGWPLPLAVLLGHRARRSPPVHRAPRSGGDASGGSDGGAAAA